MKGKEKKMKSAQVLYITFLLENLVPQNISPILHPTMSQKVKTILRSISAISTI